MKRQKRITVVCSLCLLMLSVTVQAQTVRGNIGILGKLGHWIDATTGEDLDSAYIGVPERPWQVDAQFFSNQSELLMKSSFDGSKMYQGVVGECTLEPCIRTAITTSAGIWVGYRGWGLGYYASIGGDKGSDWDMEISSDNFYVRARLHDFKGGNFETRMTGSLANPDDPAAAPEPFDFTQRLYLSSPVKIKTQTFEGVYIFNSSRFSYSAAYGQSLLQLRSAGSPLISLRYFHSDYDYAHDSNADLIVNMNDIGRIKTWQVCIGAGYAYNWVPVKNLLVSLMLMPQIAAYNHIKTHSYDSNYRQLVFDENFHGDDELAIEDYRITPMSTDSRNSRVRLNVNSRLAVTYNWPRWYISANANFYQSRYHYHSNRGRLNDWSVNANVGIRF